MAELATEIHDSPVPVAIWVGPSGARAKGLSGQLLGAAVVTGMAPGSRIGDFGDPLDVPDVPLALRLAPPSGCAPTRWGTSDARAAGALQTGVDDSGTPTLGDFIVVLERRQRERARP